jgi:HEAT repeat protein
VALDTPEYARLTRILRGGEPVVRCRAAYGLRGDPNGERAARNGHVRDALIEMARDDDHLLANTGIRSLGWPGNHEAVETLVGLMEDGNPLVQDRAARALGIIGGTRACDALIGALSDSVVRETAADALGRTKDRRAVQPLCALLKAHEDHVACAAAYALGNIGDAAAVEPLMALMQWDGPVPKQSPRMEDRFMSPPDRRFAALEALAQIGDPRAVRPILALFHSPDAHQSYDYILYRFGEDAVPPLVDALSTPDVGVRSCAAQVLGAGRRTLAYKPLVAALKDEKSGIQAEAAVAIGRIGGPGAFELLMKAAGEPTRNPTPLQESAIQGLGWLKDKRAIEPLRQWPRAKYDTSAETKADPVHARWSRLQVAEALARLGDADGVKTCLESVDTYLDEFNSVKASLDLSEMGDGVIEPLTWALFSEYPRDVSVAAEALAKMQDAKAYVAARQVVPLLPPEARLKAADAWVPAKVREGSDVSHDRAEIDLVVEILKDWPERQIRHRAVAYLVFCKAAQSVPILREIARTDPRHTIRRAAAKAAQTLAAGD